MVIRVNMLVSIMIVVTAIELGAAILGTMTKLATTSIYLFNLHRLMVSTNKIKLKINAISTLSNFIAGLSLRIT